MNFSESAHRRFLLLTITTLIEFEWTDRDLWTWRLGGWTFDVTLEEGMATAILPQPHAALPHRLPYLKVQTSYIKIKIGVENGDNIIWKFKI